MICHGLGRFVETPTLTELENGTKICHFRLCFPETIKRNDGGKKDWHYLPCEIWDTAAEFICKNFVEGDRIYITEAVARHDTWKNKNGEQRSKIVFRVNRFEKI